MIEDAHEELRKRENIWRPIAASADCLPLAEEALRNKRQIKELKAAEECWKETSAAARDERVAPITAPPLRA